MLVFSRRDMIISKKKSERILSTKLIDQGAPQFFFFFSFAIWFYKIPGLDATDDSGGKTIDQSLTDQRDYNGSNSTVSCYLIMGEAASEQRVYYNGNCNCFYGEP